MQWKISVKCSDASMIDVLLFVSSYHSGSMKRVFKSGLCEVFKVRTHLLRLCENSRIWSKLACKPNVWRLKKFEIISPPLDWMNSASWQSKDSRKSWNEPFQPSWKTWIKKYYEKSISVLYFQKNYIGVKYGCYTTVLYEIKFDVFSLSSGSAMESDYWIDK